MAKQTDPVLAHERMLRKWAHNIVSELPPDESDCRRVLVLAREIFEDSLSSRALNRKRKRKAA